MTEIRRAVPEIALSTDVIVGFPGESEAHFEATLSLLEEVRFAQAFAFSYSPRPGTAAARWESDVTPAVSAARLGRLMDRQQEIQRELNREFEGRTVEVLVEGKDRHGVRPSGRTPCNRVANVETEAALRPGTFATVLVERGYPNSLFGSLLRVGRTVENRRE